MWPRGTIAEKLATLDDRLTAVSALLRDARDHDDLSAVAELEQISDELLDARNDLIPLQRRPVD